MNKPIQRSDPAAFRAADFFARSRAKLGFDVPPGLYDPNIVPTSGDPGTDKMLRMIAREQPVRPAAVLIPIIDHPLLAPVNKIVVDRTGDLGPEIGADMEIGREAAIGGRLEPQTMR